MASTGVELRDGETIRIRPIRPDDKDALAEGFSRLSPESRYRRFFAPLDHLSGADLRYLTEVDHTDHEALIAFAAGGEPIGVARYVRSDDPGEAEVAVTVVDHWQQRGVATALLERLVERARATGIERFVALALADNDAAVELFRHLGGADREPRRSASGHLELLIELPAEEVSASQLGQALRGVARSGLLVNPWRLLRRRLAAALGDRTGDSRPKR